MPTKSLHCCGSGRHCVARQDHAWPQLTRGHPQDGVTDESPPAARSRAAGPEHCSPSSGRCLRTPSSCHWTSSNCATVGRCLAEVHAGRGRPCGGIADGSVCVGAACARQFWMCNEGNVHVTWVCAGKCEPDYAQQRTSGRHTDTSTPQAPLARTHEPCIHRAEKTCVAQPHEGGAHRCARQLEKPDRWRMHGSGHMGYEGPRGA